MSLVGLRRRLVLVALLRRPLARRGETVGQALEVVVGVLVLLGLARGPLIAVGGLLLGLLGRRDQPEIVLGVLEVAFRHHRIAGRLCIARQLQVFLADVVGSAPDFHVGAVRLVRPSQRIGAFAIVVAVIVVVAATHTLVLTRSHRCSLIGIGLWLGFEEPAPAFSCVWQLWIERRGRAVWLFEPPQARRMRAERLDGF